MARVFDSLTVRGVTFPNRLFVSPMCQYSSEDGFANDWHLVHLGSRAVGGAGLVMTEATAVTPEGRISPDDLGLWKDAHIEPLARVVSFITAHGGVAGVQLAHAGRKASTQTPWVGSGAVAPDAGGWQPLGPGDAPFADGYPVPRVMTRDDIARTIDAFVAASQRARAAGFEVIELHAAHGYLLHEFLSPLSNPRTDEYGGSFDNRIRLTLDTVRAIRTVWPDHLPLFLRISATDWTEGGWDVPDSVRLAADLERLGVDLVDVSSGGNVSRVAVRPYPGYLVDYATAVRAAGIPASAVGLITEPEQAQAIITGERADAVFVARAALRNPYWALHAAHDLGVTPSFPDQYVRGAW